MDGYDYIFKGLGGEYLYIEMTGQKSRITGLTSKKTYRLIDLISLQESMLRTPDLGSYSWENYYEEVIVDLLDRLMDELESCRSIKLTTEDKENYLLNDIVYGECKQFICQMFQECQELQYTATPDDWFYEIIQTENREGVLV